jgi:thiol-disulfide isomerase/thioredoxin
MMQQESSMMMSSGMVAEGEVMIKDEAMMGDDKMAMEKQGGAMSQDAMIKANVDAKMEAKGTYAVYSEGVIGNGQSSVLYFHAAWCPVCKTADQKITTWYESNTYPVSTYKVDYDTYTDLKKRYGVTYQHTYVLIDGQGNAVQILRGPTDAQLQALISSL